MKASETLKKATREAHDALEQTAMLERLFAPQLSRLEYAEIISRFYQLFNYLEDKIDHYSICSELGYSKRTAELKKDLTCLGWSDKPVESISGNCNLPMIDSSLQAIGVAYVLQGSMNGAPFIRRQLLKNNLFQGPLFNAMNFFCDCEIPTVRSDWQTFLNKLDNYFENRDDKDIDAAVYTANATFSVFKKQFSQISSF